MTDGPPGEVRPPAPGVSGEMRAVRVGDGSALAAVAIVAAVGLLLAGALLSGLSLEEAGDDKWKITVKVMGLSSVSFLGFSPGGALMAGVALLVAFGLARTAGPARGGIGVGILLLAVYLLLVTLVGIYVDIDALTDAEQAEGVIVGGLLGDLGAALTLAVAALCGARMLAGR